MLDRLTEFNKMTFETGLDRDYQAFCKANETVFFDGRLYPIKAFMFTDYLFWRREQEAHAAQLLQLENSDIIETEFEYV